MNIEWNPHIINKINDGAVDKLCEEEVLIENFREHLEKEKSY